MIISEKIKVGAYFYPNEPSCPVRTKRAGGIQVESEPVLVRQTKQLFPGHDQPRSYCLGDLNLTDWDDSNNKTTEKHVNLAQEACLDFFVVDSYLGIRSGKRVNESDGFISQMSKLTTLQLGNLHFGMMCCFKAPRTIMSIRPGKLEANREFDVSIDTARYIADYSATKYWEHPNYLRVNGRPYVSFFLPGTGAVDENSGDFANFFDELKNYSYREYKDVPYVVGIVSHRSPVADAIAIEKIGVDAISGYSNILNFPQLEPVVDHSSLIEPRTKEWEKISEVVNIPVEPTAQVGLDATPRCQYIDSDGKQFQPISIDQLRPFINQYPHSMIVTGSTSKTFEILLDNLLKLTGKMQIPNEEKLITVNAWNEMSEGSCMLPRIYGDNIDFSYIDSCRTMLNKYKT